MKAYLVETRGHFITFNGAYAYILADSAKEADSIAKDLFGDNAFSGRYSIRNESVERGKIKMGDDLCDLVRKGKDNNIEGVKNLQWSVAKAVL